MNIKYIGTKKGFRWSVFTEQHHSNHLELLKHKSQPPLEI